MSTAEKHRELRWIVDHPSAYSVTEVAKAAKVLGVDQTDAAAYVGIEAEQRLGDLAILIGTAEAAYTQSKSRRLGDGRHIKWVPVDGLYRVWLPGLERPALTPGVPRAVLERRGATFEA